MTARPTGDRLSDQFDIDLDVSEREIRVFGDVDMSTAPLIVTAAIAMLKSIPADLQLNLAGVTFADSSLLTAIDQIRAGLSVREGKIQLVSSSAAVKRLFLAAGVTELLSGVPGPAPVLTS
jgi:anti-anti-sigma factor